MMSALEHAKYVVAADEEDEGRYDYDEAIRVLRALIRAYEALEARKLTVTFNVNSVIDIDAAVQAIKQKLNAPNAGLPVGAPVEAIPTWKPAVNTATIQPNSPPPKTPPPVSKPACPEWIGNLSR
jgi:hypothetical protein